MALKYLKQNLKNLLPNLILVWLSIIIYNQNNYYSNFLHKETQTILIFFALTYTASGLLFSIYHSSKKIIDTKGLKIFQFFMRNYKNIFSKKRTGLNITPEEKTTILFIVVKFFFLPLMINFAINNLTTMIYYSDLIKNSISTIEPNIDFFNIITFPLMLALIFFIDTSYFSFGYIFESGFLKNKVRSVEPTILGWIVALASYPPFAFYIGDYLKWYANDMVEFSNGVGTFILRITIIILLLFYLSATIALGAKCSNLTNRGIVSRGPYAYVRHPAYITKNIGWWLTLIPIMSIPAFISMSIWSFVYYLRAITEEKHLLKDQEYREYCKKVKYRFIPYAV